MSRIPERLIERRLVEGVQALGGVAYKWVCPGHAGVPDRIVLLPGGRMLLVELKAKDGQPSAGQLSRADRLSRLGFPVRFVYGLDGVDRLLEELRNVSSESVSVGRKASASWRTARRTCRRVRKNWPEALPNWQAARKN